MSDGLERSTVMARRFLLEERIAIMEGRHKAELEPLQLELVLCERYIAKTMNDAKEQQFSIGGLGQCFFQTHDTVKVKDWNQALGFIRANELWHMLTQAANKTSVKEYIELHTAVPPGLLYETRKVLAWRKAR